MSFLSGAANGRERFRLDGKRLRAAERREAERANAQAANEAEQARRAAEYAAKTGPQTTPEQRATQATERQNAIARLHHLRAEIAQERRRLIGDVEAAVGSDDLERAIAAQIRIAALEPLDAAAERQLAAQGVDRRARPFSPVGAR
ncbi:MAG: hypothetical protein M0014_16165 [Actinomycetota bacterium]|jgi:FtsZ-interacting cell division protein YlmF|nr:hypothetical protein [Actinomycetota bacterium]